MADRVCTLVHQKPQDVAAPRGVVALVSGGLDSTTMVYWLDELGVDVLPVFVDYGQHCATTELATAREVLPPKYAARIRCMDLTSIWAGSRSRLIDAADLWKDRIRSEDLHLPYRNLVLLSAGAAIAEEHGADVVCSAFINSNIAIEPDCRASFFSQLDSLLKGYGRARLMVPFAEMAKHDVAVLASRLGVPIGQTYSCQVGAHAACGACPNCVERLDAIEHLRQHAV